MRILKILLTVVLALAALSSAYATSLWKSKANSEKSMFADRRASNVGDILMVVISESTSMAKQRQNASSNNNNKQLGFDGFSIPFLGIGSGSQLPNVEYVTTDSFSGDGSLSDTSSIDSNLAVMVVDKLPNGNLIIEGAKKVDMGGEVQYAIVRGIVRGDDITMSNTVDSSYIANAQVTFMSKGEIEKNQKKGLIPRLLDPLNLW
ncbi:flagellar basal body L-ring protein FlgH [Puniceicoccaceae bacterium K14]|nr:flagellar basal body L-ring protein FlgH [Puniceicoccaceae bacterium K14]